MTPVAPFVLLKSLIDFEVVFECTPPPSCTFVNAVFVPSITDSGVTIELGQTTKVKGAYEERFPVTKITYSLKQEVDSEGKPQSIETGEVATWDAYESLKASNPKIDRVVKFECAGVQVIDIVYTLTANYVNTTNGAPVVETIVQPVKVEMNWEFQGQKVKDNGNV